MHVMCQSTESQPDLNLGTNVDCHWHMRRELNYLPMSVEQIDALFLTKLVTVSQIGPKLTPRAKSTMRWQEIKPLTGPLDEGTDGEARLLYSYED